MVKISGIRDSSERQLSLLENNDSIESEKLMEVMNNDYINYIQLVCGFDYKKYLEKISNEPPFKIPISNNFTGSF